MSSSRTESRATGPDAPSTSEEAGRGEVLMPRMGTSVAEGTIVAWKVAVGDVVVRDQVLCEVSTDKVDVECPAFEDGVIEELVVEEGETVDVGTVIARLRTTGAPAGAAAGAALPAPGSITDPRASAAGDPLVVAETPADGGRSGSTSSDPRAARRDALRRSSPVAARLAAEHGVDLHAVAGTGRNGRVTKRDVLAARDDATPNGAHAGGASDAGIARANLRGAAVPGAPGAIPAHRDLAGSAPDEAPMHTESPYRHDPSIPVAGSRAPSAAPSAGSAQARPAVVPPPLPAPPAVVPQPLAAPPVVPADLGGTPVPASRMRRSIGDAVRRSLDAAAHCTTIVECDMSRVERERRELGLTALPLLARAAIETLQAFPALNATFDGETVVRYGERVHLGIAVSLGEDGLIAPVIHDAQDLSVQGLARRIKDLAARARAGRLSPDEVRGGTFTITNPGAAGALMATPVINLPQVAILDLEAIVRRPVVIADADGHESIGIRPMVHLCMGWDHRALDGLYAAQFLTALRSRVEDRSVA